MRTCKKCFQTKPELDFHTYMRARRQYLRPWCKDCYNAYQSVKRKELRALANLYRKQALA
jgi:hypothetical protein